MKTNKCIKCGGAAEHIKIYDSKREHCFFRCKTCGRETKVYTSKQNAIDAWNSGKLTKTNEDMIESLRQRADVGKMAVQDKLVMLEAADKIEMLVDDKTELEAIVDLRNKRKWYTKFVKEVFQKIPGKELSHPDFDYIYEQYFKLLEENEKWRADWADNQRKWEVAYDKLDKEKHDLIKKNEKSSKYEIYEIKSEMWKCDETHFPNEVAFRIQWVANVGFGELTFIYNTKTNTWNVDDEHMSEEFCNAVLSKWLNGVYTGENAVSKLNYGN